MSSISEALNYIDGVYHRLRDKHIWWKTTESGNIRLEWLHLWLLSEEDCVLFWKLQKRAVKKFPKFGKEIAKLGRGGFKYPQEWQKYFDEVLK